MRRSARFVLSIAACMVVVAAASALIAQGALAPLGLTEATARAFVINEFKTPSLGRSSEIVHAGERGFLKLPPAARGPAASALFAWAKAYVNSAAFKTAYATFRKGAVPQSGSQEPTLEEELQKKMDEIRAQIAEMRQAAASLPPAQAKDTANELQKMEESIRSGEMERMEREMLEGARADKGAASRATDERYPSDPQVIDARRLREFLKETADANFSAKTLSLTGGVDGIVMVERADQKRSWLWQEAVIVGREATTAARAAAEEWLKEIER
jgi:hypothetical protein